MAPATLVLALYSGQILMLVSVAAAASFLLRVSAPTVRLAYWRVIGLLCLALPAVQPLRPDAGGGAAAFAASIRGGVAREPYAPALATAGEYVFWIWVSGVVLRLAWLLAGAYRLRRLRRRSTVANLGAEIEALKPYAPHAELRWSPDLAQPATFGVLRPVVLFPRRFADLSVEAQRAVVCHELLHVARRDWISIVLEESIRAAFWFHPAVWWLIDQMQLAREEVIDALVVAQVASKRAYMTALLAFVDSAAPTSPSIAFLRRRHLRSRFRQLSKESRMSFKRMAWAAAALLVVMISAAAVTVRALPFDIRALVVDAGTRDIGQGEVADGHDPDVTLPVVVKRVQATYTQAALAARIEGDVMLSAVVLKDGTVGEVTVTKSLDREYGLDDKAVEAMKQFQFKPGTKKGSPVAVRIDVQIRFTLK